MMQALIGLGHQVSLATLKEPTVDAVRGLDLASTYTLAGGVGNGNAAPEPLLLAGFQERFRSYWGIDPQRIRAVGAAADHCEADAVVVVGLNVLPYLGAVRRPLRVWYAADEWAWHHWSQVRWLDRSTWGELKQALVKGLYERTFGPLLDKVWVVSEADRRAMRWVAGVRDIDVLPNGVDSDHYHPMNEQAREQSCVFWGRLDFGPNVQALEWFCRRVWPRLKQAVPDATFSIFGFQPTPAVERLVSSTSGVELIPDRPDIRAEVCRRQVVVLPFVSGGGIKNKLLEAAAMGMSVVCSQRTCAGLHSETEAPFLLADRPGDWVSAVQSLWDDPDKRRTLGEKARRWAVSEHNWNAVAQKAVAGFHTVHCKPTKMQPT
jgi:polysaccharide biosynthesis protein PslH